MLRAVQGRKAHDLGLLSELKFAFLAQWLVQSIPEWWFDVQFGLLPQQAEFSVIPVEALAPLSQAHYSPDAATESVGCSGSLHSAKKYLSTHRTPPMGRQE